MWKWMMPTAALVTGLTIFSGCATAPPSPEGKAALSHDVETALAEAKVQDPSLQALLDGAYAYAIFPTVGKGAIGVGGAYGKGEVFERGKQIGYCDLSQATIGLALGGQSFTEIIAFEKPAALDDFKNGNLKFAAQATATALKTGTSSNARYTDGVLVLTANSRGLMAELSLGGQTFTFLPL